MSCQERLREQHAEKERKPLLPIARGAREPRARRRSTTCREPAFTGLAARRARPRDPARVHRLAVLLPRLGAEGQVPGDPRAARGARALRRRAASCSTRSCASELLQARGVYGFWPAHADGRRRRRSTRARASRFLRQQTDYGDSRPNRCLADYVAPAGDHIGAFAVAIHGADELAARYEAEHDDYRAIMVKALADRLAEAFAEYLHQQARREWYEPASALERGAGRRAVPRHPARVRLPGLPRPHREAEAVRPARR